MTPQAQEAMVAAEAAWYEADGIIPHAVCQAWVHKGWRTAWQLALEWAAIEAHQEADRGRKTGLDRIALRAFADRLQEDASTLGQQGERRVL